MNQNKKSWIFNNKSPLTRKLVERQKRFATQASDSKVLCNPSLVINPNTLSQKQISQNQNPKNRPNYIMFPKTPKKQINPQEFNDRRKIETEPNQNEFAKQYCQNHGDDCFCMDCDCGRHLCNLAMPLAKPHITMKTTYQSSFVKPKVNKIYNESEKSRSISNKVMPIENSNNESQILKIKSRSIPFPLLTKQTQYERTFVKQNQEHDDLIDLQKSNRPRDQLSQDTGPIQTTTTYNQSFIGHKGSNQYVKSKQSYLNHHILFKATSTYKKDFVQRFAQKYKGSFGRKLTEKEEEINRIINRTTCFSAYQKSFTNHMQINQEKPELQNEKKDDVQKRVKTLEDCYFKPQRSYTPNNQDLTFVSNAKVSGTLNHQSTYHRQFQIRNGKIYCPARMKIKTINRSKMSSMKRKCKDNTNFKQFLASVTQF